jgi:hypothetical protein
MEEDEIIEEESFSARARSFSRVPFGFEKFCNRGRTVEGDSNDFDQNDCWT